MNMDEAELALRWMFANRSDKNFICCPLALLAALGTTNPEFLYANMYRQEADFADEMLHFNIPVTLEANLRGIYRCTKQRESLIEGRNQIPEFSISLLLQFFFYGKLSSQMHDWYDLNGVPSAKIPMFFYRCVGRRTSTTLHGHLIQIPVDRMADGTDNIVLTLAVPTTRGDDALDVLLSQIYLSDEGLTGLFWTHCNMCVILPQMTCTHVCVDLFPTLSSLPEVSAHIHKGVKDFTDYRLRCQSSQVITFHPCSDFSEESHVEQASYLYQRDPIVYMFDRPFIMFVSTHEGHILSAAVIRNPTLQNE